MSALLARRAALGPPAPPRHLVQFYRGGEAVEPSVAAWLAPPLLGAGAAVLIGTREHAEGVRAGLARLGVDVAGAEAGGRLVVLDAEETLARFMQDGAPHGARFKRVARGLVGGLRAASAGGEVRAWGEMVDLLWKAGDRRSARTLELLWNDVIEEHDIHLLCSYELDPLGPSSGGDASRMCHGHAQFVPSLDGEALDRAVRTGLDETIGPGDGEVAWRLLGRRPEGPPGLPAAFVVLGRLERFAPALAGRVRDGARRALGR